MAGGKEKACGALMADPGRSGRAAVEPGQACLQENPIAVRPILAALHLFRAVDLDAHQGSRKNAWLRRFRIAMRAVKAEVSRPADHVSSGGCPRCLHVKEQRQT
ncbi:hypothetical protein G8A07_03360 [Roseateles sp. DAIF2]|uniref:hypothetical protein n=1 Tax=Roseateles sp. DAIF2 TaxID=2714952 RepID=UPI0018A2BFC3|nr:hypothetical protein [Roseateles sp. DAIF2]QPF72065.1 hypothetical protein G8A07_03360 [Roseateles sp. DAIF2]